jgi:hypothetical protein
MIFTSVRVSNILLKSDMEFPVPVMPYRASPRPGQLRASSAGVILVDERKSTGERHSRSIPEPVNRLLTTFGASP